MWDAVKRMLLRAVLSGSETGQGQLERIGLGIDWALVNEAAREWVLGTEGISGYLQELYDQIQESSRRALRQEIAAWIESGEALPDLVKRLEPTFGKKRAELIASTEVTRAYAEGNTRAWQASGLVTLREWRTANDERVCPVCGPLHKKRAGFDEPFEGGPESPPAHPRCRCWLVPVVEVSNG